MNYSSMSELFLMLLILIGTGIKVNKSSIPLIIPGKSIWTIIAIGFSPILVKQFCRMFCGSPDSYTATMLIPSIFLILSLFILWIRTKGVIVFGLSQKSAEKLLEQVKVFDQNQQCVKLQIDAYDPIRCAVIKGQNFPNSQLSKILTDNLKEVKVSGRLPFTYFTLVFGLVFLWIVAAIMGLLSF